MGHEAGRESVTPLQREPMTTTKRLIPPRGPPVEVLSTICHQQHFAAIATNLCEQVPPHHAEVLSLVNQNCIKMSDGLRHSALIPTVNRRPWKEEVAAVGVWRSDQSAVLTRRQPARTGPAPAARSGPPTSSASTFTATSPRSGTAGWPTPHDCSFSPSRLPGCARRPPPS